MNMNTNVGGGELVKARQQPALSEKNHEEEERIEEADFWSRWSELPFVAKLCFHLGVGQIVLCLLTLLAFGLGPGTKMTTEMSWNFVNARNMLLPAYVMEACTLLSSSAGSSIRLTGYNMSRLVMTEFTMKLATYSLMAASGTIFVHSNLRSYGEPRPVGSLRFLEWCVTVPVFLTMNNYPFIGNIGEKEFLFRIMPGLLVTFGYVLASWVALVTPNAFMGWFLLTLVNITFAISVWDQMAMVAGMKDTTTNYNFKLGVVISKDVIFFAYGLVYLLAVFDLMSPTQEQVFYTYGDVILKVWQASCLVVLRNWQDLVTVQRTFECQISRSKEDTARLIRKANALMLVMDIQGVISGWNEHLANVTGIPENAAVGKKFQDVVRPESSASVDHALVQCRQGLSCGGIELELSVADGCGSDVDSASGSAVTILVSFIMQLGSDTSSIIVVGQDLTELVARRALEERQARFESIVSHELRSPLHGIIGLSSVMAEASSDKVQKKQLGMIQGCADRLLDLVNNIMESHQQWTAGSKTTDEVFQVRHPVNIMEVIKEVCEMTRASVDKAGKPLLKPGMKLINKTSCKRFPVVQGDQQKLTQMLYNITTNACNFTTKGSITASLRCDSDFGNGFLELDIADTGPGIAPGALKRIFEPFEQEDSKDTRKFQGVGLGLSVAQNIAKSHGGSIAVKSNMGKGSIFVVRLPVESNMSALYARGTTEESIQTISGPRTDDEMEVHERAAADDENSMQEKAEQVKLRLNELRAKQERSIAEHAGQNPLVLIVDSDQISQQVVSQNLQSMARTQQCLTAAEAINFLRHTSERPRLVIVDLALAGLGGLEVCMEIRHHMGLSHLDMPIIVLCTRTAREELATQAFWAGATDLVQMPATGAFLRMRVKVSLDMQEIGVSPSVQAPVKRPPTPVAATSTSTQITPVNSARSSSVGALRKKYEPAGTGEPAAEPAPAPSGGPMEGRGRRSSEHEVSSPAAQQLAASLAQCRAKLEEAAVNQAKESARFKQAEARLQEEARACQEITRKEQLAAAAKSTAEASLADRETQIQRLKAELEAANARATTAAAKATAAEAAAASAAAVATESRGHGATASASSGASPVAAGAAGAGHALGGMRLSGRGSLSAAIGSYSSRPVVSQYDAEDSSGDEAPPSLAASQAGGGGSGLMDPIAFWRAELESCRSDIKALRKKLSKEESEAYVQRTRADARERELVHLRGQLRRARSQLCSRTNSAAPSELDERMVGG